MEKFNPIQKQFTQQEIHVQNIIKNAMFSCYKRGFNNGNLNEAYNDYFVKTFSQEVTSSITDVMNKPNFRDKRGF